MADSSTPKHASLYKPDEPDRYILGMLYETEYMREQHMRSLYGLGASSVNARIKRLVDVGLVERRRPPSDKRQSQVPYLYQLTKAAHPYLPKLVGGQQFRQHNPITKQELTKATTGHPLAVADLAVAVLTALGAITPPDLTLDWWGEHRSQIRLASDALHPQAERWVKPDGTLRLMTAGPEDWRKRHVGQACSAWWVEVDRGTEDQPDWIEKVGRYARAIRGQEWRGVLGKIPLPGLLVTVAGEEDRDGDMVSRALWISHAAVAAGLPKDWIIWIAQHRAVSTSEGIAAEVWRQVQIHSKTTADNVLFGAAWSLPTILAPQQLYPMAAHFERRRQQAEAAREKVAAERKRQEQQGQGPFAAALPAVSPPVALSPEVARIAEQLRKLHSNWTESDILVAAKHRHEMDEWVALQEAASEERQRQAEAEEVERQRIAAVESAYRRSFVGRVGALRNNWWRNAKTREMLSLRALVLATVLVWLQVYLIGQPTLVQIIDERQQAHTAILDQLSDFHQSPQFWFIVVALGIASTALLMWWGEQAYSRRYR